MNLNFSEILECMLDLNAGIILGVNILNFMEKFEALFKNPKPEPKADNDNIFSLFANQKPP